MIMARKESVQRNLIVTILAWSVGLLVFFPILWTIMTSFKAEGDAIKISSFFSTGWTTEAYATVQSRSNYFQFAWNSIAIALGSTLFALVIAIPSACVDAVD
jgi:sorbitol/mannitol transport system permease protein